MIAHVPAGYLLVRRIGPRLATGRTGAPRLMVLGLLGSIFPDIDLFYFYLADGRQTLHHDYWTHIPAFWLCAALAAAALMMLARVTLPWRESLVFLAGVLLHLQLDSIAGGVAWAWPVSQHRFVLVEVPARFDWWVWNFVLHWSFLAEIAICVWAGSEFRLVQRLRNSKARIAQRILPRKLASRARDES